MKRRILPLLLAAVLLADIPWRASAGEEDLFSPTRHYEEQFSDVSTADWFYENVKALYELGLANGQNSCALFAPEAEITAAEALTLAARLRSLWEYGDSETGPALYSGDGAWYRPYVAYLQSQDAVGQEFEGGYGRSATRAQVAHILAHALPRSLLEPLNEEAVAAGYGGGTHIRDVGDAAPYREDILLLYTWGILSGMDRTGAFHPEETIPRCQVAAMVTRLADPELRIRLDWDAAPGRLPAGAALKDLVYSDGSFYAAPASISEIEADVRYTLSRGERLLALSYPPDSLTRENVRQLMDAFLTAMRGFIEQTYNEVQCSYSLLTGTVLLTFSSSLYGDGEIERYRAATMDCAVEVRDSLWEKGIITAGMTQYDKARAYFTWLCENCTYDYAGIGAEDSMSHSGYRAFAEGLAVCDGYTAAYNLLLKLEGIDCTTRSAGDHIWTVADLDGTAFHIDATWGDQADTVAYRYFAMTEADAMARFPEE